MSGSTNTGPGILGGDIAQEPDRTLASPCGSLLSPAITLVWGKQVELEDADDPDLELFIAAYQLGAQPPELGAGYTGGVGASA